MIYDNKNWWLQVAQNRDRWKSSRVCMFCSGQTWLIDDDDDDDEETKIYANYVPALRSMDSFTYRELYLNW